ncbi:hypothetical protein ASPWEDRAFT_30915 [Aspergillus wentii DTO 134E9]|uniref:Uncharacterized protein n=1 Tax=Aspergillus wentii DTO 134E9 TaxID=1073089 RepID=A0A1L9RAM0_ASPWE|nr:uncharacterized protein ASPWEDRAFT_30915 [Aspergillus wentii DTO 134E9]KAI9934549.1 hypothetical protein MW887_000164 [Aspergillus wentii]OJJ31964.1 hypothetical protein ASPWEDRAFT_30915 [Aspergillus wentii DTO 134E9]
MKLFKSTLFSRLLAFLLLIGLLSQVLAAPTPLELDEVEEIGGSLESRSPSGRGKGRGGNRGGGRGGSRGGSRGGGRGGGRGGNSGSSSKPKYPTVEEVEKALDVKKNAAIFYSGPEKHAIFHKTYEDLTNKEIGKRSYLKNYKTVRESFNPSNWAKKYIRQNKIKDQRKFWEIASKAYANKAEGTVYVMLPEEPGTKWHENTIWDKTEWPTLKASHKVQNVIRINPDNDHQEAIKGKVVAEDDEKTDDKKDDQKDDKKDGKKH